MIEKNSPMWKRLLLTEDSEESVQGEDKESHFNFHSSRNMSSPVSTRPIYEAFGGVDDDGDGGGQGVNGTYSLSDFGGGYIRRDSEDHREALWKRRKRCLIIAGAVMLMGMIAVVLVVVFAVDPAVRSTIYHSSFDLGPEINFTEPTSIASRMVPFVYISTATSIFTLKKAIFCDADLVSLDVNFQVSEKGNDGRSNDTAWINVGKLHLPKIKLRSGKVDSEVLMLRNVKLSIQNAEGWARFSERVLQEREVLWRLHGTLDVTLFTFNRGSAFSFVRFVLPKTRVRATGSSRGMAGFSNSTYPASIDTFDIMDTYATSFQHLRFRLYNPSPFWLLPIGRLAMTMWYQERAVSLSPVLTTGNVSVTGGWNAWNLEGPLEPTNVTLLNEMLSRFFSGKSSFVDMTFDVGTSNASSSRSDAMSLYSAGLVGLSIPTTLKRQRALNFTTEVVLQIKHNKLVEQNKSNANEEGSMRNDTLPLWAGLRSPFAASRVVVTGIRIILWYGGGVNVAVVNEASLSVILDPDKGNFSTNDDDGDDEARGEGVVALTGSNASQALDAMLSVFIDSEAENITRKATVAFLSALGTQGYAFGGVGVSGTLSLRVGSLPLQLTYTQEGVPCCALRYAISHNATTSKCSKPPTDTIKGENLRTHQPTIAPTASPSASSFPSLPPTSSPSLTLEPSNMPSDPPTLLPSKAPSSLPSMIPSPIPSGMPSSVPQPKRLQGRALRALLLPRRRVRAAALRAAGLEPQVQLQRRRPDDLRPGVVPVH